MDSKFDRAVRGGDPLSQKEKRGFDLFSRSMIRAKSFMEQIVSIVMEDHFLAIFRAHDNGLKKRPSDDPYPENI